MTAFVGRTGWKQIQGTQMVLTASVEIGVVNSITKPGPNPSYKPYDFRIAPTPTTKLISRNSKTSSFPEPQPTKQPFTFLKVDNNLLSSSLTQKTFSSLVSFFLETVSLY